MALANTTIDSVEPSNPAPGESFTLTVQAVMTYIDPDFYQCASVFFEADVLVGGNVVTSFSGLTQCEGDESYFPSATLSLPAGSHDVRVEGVVHGFNEDEQVSDKSGTINVEAESATVGNTSISTSENEATLSYTVNNPNNTSVTATVEHVVNGNTVDTVDISLPSGGSSNESFTATFDLTQDTNVDLCANVTNTVA